MAGIPGCTTRNRGVWMCIFWRMRPHHCRANNRTFWDIALRYLWLSATKLIFYGLSRSWKFYKHHSRTLQEAWEPWSWMPKQPAGGCINYLQRRIIAKVATADWYPLHRPYHCCPLINIHTYKHLFNGPFSGTTHVSRYQKGKTNLDFTEARDSEWQWQQSGPILSVFPTLCTPN